MKTSHIFASLVLAAGLLSGCSKPAPAPAEAPAPAVEPAPAPEAAPAPEVVPEAAPSESSSAASEATEVPPAQ